MRLHLPISEFVKHIQSEDEVLDPSILIETIVYDTRKIANQKSSVFFALEGSFRDGHTFIEEGYQKGIRIFVVNKNKDLPELKNAVFLRVHSPIQALQALALQHRLKYKLPIIAITGSVGKTTVKEWIYHLLSDSLTIVRSPKSYNSQLGVALSLLEINENHQLALIEAGISEPGEMKLLEQMIQPSFGLFTSFGRAHAHSFPSKETHLQEKLSLFTQVKQTWIHESIELSKDEVQQIQATLVHEKEYQTLLQHSPFQDKVSLHNLSLALAIAYQFEKEENKLIEKIKSLPRLALRMETFEGIHQTTIINDAYNMDLDALTQSLEYQISISENKNRFAILATDGLSEIQVNQIKSILVPFNLDGVFYIQGNEIPPIASINNATVLIKGTRNAQLQRIARLFQLKKHKTRLEIDLSAIRNNVDYYRSLIPKSCNILAMVKASSYGSGAIKMAQFLQNNGVNYLGVAYADEGVELRKNGIQLPILVMNAEEDSFDDIINYQLEPSIFSFEMLDKFIKSLINYNVENYPVHLKFDTGMRRLGFEVKEVRRVLEVFQTQPEIRLQSVYSHLADSDNQKDRSFSENQIALFTTIVNEIQHTINYPFLKHIANSEGIHGYPHAHFDMVRLGIGMYGYSANENIKSQLTPAIAWKSVITQIKSIAIGESVGYSRTFIATRPTKIAVVPIGYADGFRKSLGNGIGGMYVQGHYCKILGNVCMDMTMIDVTDVATYEGDTVEIIGENQTLDGLAKMMGTIPYEVLTSVSQRVHRIYIED